MPRDSGVGPRSETVIPDDSNAGSTVTHGSGPQVLACIETGWELPFQQATQDAVNSYMKGPRHCHCRKKKMFKHECEHKLIFMSGSIAGVKLSYWNLKPHGGSHFRCHTWHLKTQAIESWFKIHPGLHREILFSKIIFFISDLWTMR